MDHLSLIRAWSIRTRRLILALSLLATLMLPALAGKAATSASDFPHQAVHYFNGASQVDLVVALDELVAENATETSATERLAREGAGLATATRLPHNGGVRIGLRLTQPAADLAQLEAKAAAVRAKAPGAEVLPALYAPHATKRGEDTRQLLTRRLALQLKEGVKLADLPTSPALRITEQLDYSPRTYRMEVKDTGLLESLNAANAIYASGLVEFATPEIIRLRQKRAVPNDPLFSNQWHLRNTGSNLPGATAIAGNDLNVVPAWDTHTGTGVVIAISDDGVKTTHPDLAPNCRTDIDIDLVDSDGDPDSNSSADDHGTSCAGVAAARWNNGIGVSGVAPTAQIVGVRLLGLNETDATEAQAMAHQVAPALASNRVWINSNSWGPNDDGQTLETFGPLTRAAIINGTTNGRGGLGTIYTWAAGNGLETADELNFDGYASSRYTIAVAATSAAGLQSYYSEPGAAMVINTPSSFDEGGNGYGITTVNYSAYTSDFGGTSSACPAAAGGIALILQSNPNLGWRDVQHILAHSSTQNNPTDSSWKTNGAGIKHSHKYGFGRLNAAAAIALAATWTNVPALATSPVASEAVAVAIPDNNATGISRPLSITAPANFHIEHVEVTVNITHPYRGDLDISLTAPSGMSSNFATGNRNDGNNNFSNWLFTSVAHWGEQANGTWTLKIADRAAADTGTLNSWSLTLYGYVQTFSSAKTNWTLY